MVLNWARLKCHLSKRLNGATSVPDVLRSTQPENHGLNCSNCTRSMNSMLLYVQGNSYGAGCLDLPYTSTQSDISSLSFSPSSTLHLEHSSLLVDPSIHHVLTQSRIKGLAFGQNSDSSDLMLPCDHHCSRDAFASGAPKPIAASSGRCHVQSRLAAKVPGVENLEEIELAASGGPAVEGCDVSMLSLRELT